jgi:hypothetical protein
MTHDVPRTNEGGGMATAEALTLGAAAARLGLPLWRLQRAFTLGLLPVPMRAGRLRLVPADQLPIIRAALERAGYLRPA